MPDYRAYEAHPEDVNLSVSARVEEHHQELIVRAANRQVLHQTTLLIIRMKFWGIVHYDYHRDLEGVQFQITQMYLLPCLWRDYIHGNTIGIAIPKL